MAKAGGYVATGTTNVARLTVGGGCWAEGAIKVARLADARGSWAAEATKVARLAKPELLGNGGDKSREIVNHVRPLKRVDAAVCLKAPRATGGVEGRIIDGFWKVDQGRTWVVEEPYVASEDVGGLLDFTKPPGTIKERE